jgi:hypothetical protein
MAADRLARQIAGLAIEVAGLDAVAWYPADAGAACGRTASSGPNGPGYHYQLNLR